MHNDIRIEYLKLYASFVKSQTFSKFHLVVKAQLSMEKYEYSITCFKIKYLRIYLG